MTPGKPLKLTDFLPHGMSADNAYVLLAGIAAFLCVFAIGNSFRRPDRMAPKIKALQERRRELRNDAVGPRKRKKPESSVNFMRAVVMRLQLLKNSQIGKTQSVLIEAGLRSKDAIFILAFFKLVLPIVLGIAGLVMMKLESHPGSKWQAFNYLWPIAGAYLGMKLPGIYVHRKRKKRYLFIQRALADTLDLLTICAEAGLSLSAGLARVARELAFAYPEMAEEASLTSLEMGFLPDRNKALTNLSERVTMPEVRGIVSVLIQTEKYGTPIAQALRVLSAEFREARMLRAEQKAARLPALMTVPMITFILPTLFIVIIAPAAVKISDSMAGMGN